MKWASALWGRKSPIKFFEMTLERVGDSSWPAEGAVAPE